MDPHGSAQDDDPGGAGRLVGQGLARMKPDVDGPQTGGLEWGLEVPQVLRGRVLKDQDRPRFHQR
jgi:hypothetical protein